MMSELKPQFEIKGSSIYHGRAEELLHGMLGSTERVVVISDVSIDRLHHSLLAPYKTLFVGQGESSKTLKSVESLVRSMIQMGVDRTWRVVGIGGGVVTDIAGFVASIYMRGLRFGFVPTTLLSQVDASVGGKNGVNVDGYKNMIGTFTQPEFVICDSTLLQTLSDKEFRAGVSESIKSAIIGDVELFDMLSSESLESLRKSEELLQRTVTGAVAVKAGIVTRDEREQGERRLLNLGHTFAHAIEKSSREYGHGEAVAIGMVMAASVAERLSVADSATSESIRRCIERYGLPTQHKISKSKLLSAIAKDKKGDGDLVNLILPRRVGECVIYPIEVEKLKELQ